ncbi:hypothetical protein ACFX12_032701 [Malus domestica]
MKIIRRAISSVVIWGQKSSISQLKSNILEARIFNGLKGKPARIEFMWLFRRNMARFSWGFMMGLMALVLLITCLPIFTMLCIKELKGLLWNDKFEIEIENAEINSLNTDVDSSSLKETNRAQMGNRMPDGVD